jgi:diadenosine tetraphosphate (Ap4A) HIT family hydrolase
MSSSPCVLCNPFNEWPKSHIICTLSASTVLLSQDQYFEGWCLVVSNKHVVDLFDLPAEERLLLESDVSKVSKSIVEIFQPNIMNYAVFGNVIPHLHWNVMPRYINDGLWGAPPWPHNPKKLLSEEASELSKRIKLQLLT